METSNQVLDAVLKDLALPHIEERLPRDFFYKLGLKFPEQYGIACRDVADCVRRAEALGAGPFLHATVLAPNWVEHGERVRRCKLEVALGYAGDAQIEFLGPGQGTQHYARALVDTDIAFHHVGIFQRGIDALGQTLAEAGYPEVVRGGIALGKALRIDFRYYDSRPDHGIYLELLDFTSFGRELNIKPFLHLGTRSHSKTRLFPTPYTPHRENSPQAMPTYETEITIDAPPAAVWKHLIDVGRHDEWSEQFKLRGEPIAGGPARIEFSLFGISTGVNVAYQTVDEPRELRWHGGPKGLVYGSHFCILEPLDGGSRTRFRHGESFSGLLAPLVVRLLRSKLGAPSYGGFNEDLRRRVLS